MTVRSIVQVVAGAVAGAALVGIPTWAAAGQQDDTSSSSSSSDMTAMMDSPESQDQMMDSMSQMMRDPEMLKQMRSMMSDAMGEMSGMEGGVSGHGKSGQGKSAMRQMHDMDRGSKPGRSANQ